jgi:hypothetical protein
VGEAHPRWPLYRAIQVCLLYCETNSNHILRMLRGGRSPPPSPLAGAYEYIGRLPAARWGFLKAEAEVEVVSYI